MNIKNRPTRKNPNEWKIRCSNLYVRGSKEFKQFNLLWDLNLKQ